MGLDVDEGGRSGKVFGINDAMCITGNAVTDSGSTPTANRYISGDAVVRDVSHMLKAIHAQEAGKR